ncbi:MAG: GMC family oxidoreductase N-terminal domain-containing protein [Terriglobia bacterium]
MNGGLANAPEPLKNEYSMVVIGSGYGGAITACRLAMAGQRVCILERGAEWPSGAFPDTLLGIQQNARSSCNPLGLYEYLRFSDLDIIKGCGLGGTSLINGGVALRPEPDFFTRNNCPWPKALQKEWESGTLQKYYERAEKSLRVQPHPGGQALGKVQALRARSDHAPGAKFDLVNIAVNFQDGVNEFGVQQRACTDCGDCMTGCNVRAKNTLDTNYLAGAKQHGAEIYTGIKVEFIEKAKSGDGYLLHYRRMLTDREEEDLRQLKAAAVILAAGTIGSTEILLRSHGPDLPLSKALGARFSANGNFFGAAYNSDRVTNALGFGNHQDERSQVKPGPGIVGGIRYFADKPLEERILIEDLSIPRAFVDVMRVAFPAISAATGDDTDFSLSDELAEAARASRDLAGWNPDGALNRTMIYIAMMQDGSEGEILLDRQGKLRVSWPGVLEQPILRAMNKELRNHAAALGAIYFQNPRWHPLLGRNLITAHPLGGCPMSDSFDTGVVDDHGRVYSGQGGFHRGLYVADASIIPECLGRNPLLTISALSERIAEFITKEKAGVN